MLSKLRDLPNRRTVLATMGTGVAALLTPRSDLQAEDGTRCEIAKGYVRDASATAHDGMPSGARGIANVMVSNGREVCTTDANGFWSLPVHAGESVFVIKPAHWRYVQSAGIPQFSYLYQPDGTPAHLNLRGPTLAPTGPLPDEIVFHLLPQPQADDFDVVLVADTQTANAEELDFFRCEIRDQALHRRAQFVISHGDVMGDDLGLLSDYRTIIDNSQLVWHHCPGNHDLNLDSVDPKFAFEAWKRTFGPTHYAFQHAGATFILLNNVDYLGHGTPSANGRSYRGAIGARQRQFVENVLKNVPDEQLVVVSMHIPLVNFESPDDPADTTEDRRHLLQMLSQRPHTLSFSGHSHTTEHHYLGAADGFARSTPHHHHVLTAFCGSWWSGPHDHRGIPVADSRDGSPRGYHILSVRGNAYVTRFVPLTGHTEPSLRALTQPSQAPASHHGATAPGASANTHELLVDVFDGGPRTRVTCELIGADGVRLELVRSSVRDPYIVETFASHRSRLKPWVEASVSSHIWTAAIPHHLPPGDHACTIRVMTEYNHEIALPYTLSIGV